MKRLALIGALALCTQLSGCFVVFIPGSLISKASDGITGDKGEHCVVATAKVGDVVRLSDGRLYSVASLSGKSMRCQQEATPLRAELVPLADLPAAIADVPKPPSPAAAPVPTEAERTAACAAMDAVKPGAPQAEFQAAWAGLNRLGMTWRDCSAKKPA